MAFGQDDDDSQRVALGLLAGIIGVVVAVVVGFGVYKAQHPAASAAGTLQQAERAATVAAVAPAPDGAGVVVENGVVKFYFATGKADLADGANAALADAVAAAKSG